MIEVELHDASMIKVCINYANLSYINMSYAELKDVDMKYANLYIANLNHAKLCGVNLYSANIKTDLCNSSLIDVDLSGANLSSADLRCASLRKVKCDEHTAFYALQCPEEGSFIGYKKAHGYIIKLEILADAKRSSATSRKCRCSAAKVLSITAVDGSEEVKEIASDKDPNFIYRVGEIVRVDNFDENRWNECSTGIHFFITRREAEQYST